MKSIIPKYTIDPKSKKYYVEMAKCQMRLQILKCYFDQDDTSNTICE